MDTVDTAIGVGGQVAGQSVAVLRALGEAVKPALPVLQSAGEQAVNRGGGRRDTPTLHSPT